MYVVGCLLIIGAGAAAVVTVCAILMIWGAWKTRGRARAPRRVTTGRKTAAVRRR